MKNIIFLFLMLFLSKVNSQVTLETYYETSNSQINIYLVSQGYDSAHMSEFNSFVSGFLNQLWSTTPFDEFQSNFRIILVRDVAATNGYPKAFNQFDPAYVCSGGNTTGSEDYTTFKTRMDNLIANNISGYDEKSYLIAVFNNQYYTAGGGEYTFTSSYCGNTMMYNVAIHEFGHTFGLLGDEYGSTTATVDPDDFPLFYNRNVTDQTSLSNIPWKYLIDSSTPIPTCYFGSSCSYTVPGLYEEANYVATGWYRPQNNCKMRNVNQSFCSVCQDLLRETIIKHLCPTDSAITENFINKHQYLMHWRKASNSLSSHSVIGEEISVTFLSQNEVLLTDGFTSKNGSDFLATVGDCNTIDLHNEYRISGRNALDYDKEILNVNVKEEIDFVLYPNPNNGSFNLQLTAISDKVAVNVYDMRGRLILNKQVQANGLVNEAIELTNAQAGIYLVTIEDGARKVTKKIVVE
ncbi:M64 family metallopeptidase [Flavobacterium sp. U410]